MNRIIKSQSKVIIEETEFKDGQLYIKREIKTGEEAEKEIEKHSNTFSKMMEDFINNFFK
jgi:hypothetical protein